MNQSTLQARRYQAASCLQLSSMVAEYGPTLRKYFFGQGIRPSFLKKIIRWILIQKCEKLILFNDTSIKVTVLKAMETIEYHSQHVGLIASYYNSKDSGKFLGQGGRELGGENLGHAAYLYLMHTLDLRETNVFDEMEHKIRHWEGCLDIDYSNDMKEEKRWVEINGELKLQIKKLSEEELQDKLKHNRQETISLARDDLQEYMQKMSPEYIQAQRLKILESIRKIFEHIFFVEKNVDNIAEVLLLLDTLARRKNFPRIWLINLAKELINNPKLSPVLKNLLI